MTTCDEVFENNRQWVEQKKKQQPEFFDRLAEGQHPDFLFIGCSDSRAPAATIMGLEPGEVFVHRNVGNLMVNTDVNAHSVLEYAVEHLEVDHIVVCGHYGCGAVQAATEPKDLGLLNGWLREIRDVYRLHREELDAIDDPEQRRRRLVELNIREQCTQLVKTAVVQRHYLNRGGPHVHGWVFCLSDGRLRDLEFPFEQKLDEIRETYDLAAGD